MVVISEWQEVELLVDSFDTLKDVDTKIGLKVFVTRDNEETISKP